MEILLGQIRSKKAREMVSEEIEAHIDDQAEVYRRKGMKDRDAEYRAVCEMGDPVETGAALDRIHRPQAARSMIILVGIMNAVGLLILSRLSLDPDLFRHQICYAAVGFAVMILICMLDYTWIGKWCGTLSICFLGVFNITVFSGGVPGNASYCFRILGGVSISIKMFVYLSLPLFAALLYKYRKQKWYHMLVPAAFMAAVIFIFGSYMHSVMIMLNLILLSAVLLTFAVAKGWYPVKKKIFLGSFWGCLVGLPCFIILCRMYSGAATPYQMLRMKDFLAGNHVIWSDRQLLAQILFSGSRWMGQTLGEAALPGDSLSLACDYMILHVISCYGILALLAIIGLFAFLCSKMFRMSLRQKNQFGMIMGLSCSIVFTLEILEYLMMNLGLLLPTTVFLPLFSYGGSGTIISYIFLGILISVYRYQNLVKEKPSRKSKYRIRIERIRE